MSIYSYHEDYDLIGVPNENSTVGLIAYHMGRQESLHIIEFAPMDEVIQRVRHIIEHEESNLYDFAVLTDFEKQLVTNVKHEFFKKVVSK